MLNVKWRLVNAGRAQIFWLPRGKHFLNYFSNNRLPFTIYTFSFILAEVCLRIFDWIVYWNEADAKDFLGFLQKISFTIEKFSSGFERGWLKKHLRSLFDMKGRFVYRFWKTRFLREKTQSSACFGILFREQNIQNKKRKNPLSKIELMC